ncbi:MAG: DUF488 domain-containing protein [Saprospiraceae bacterium]|nr:DUF488 domain-containing protein [Saprospiraceae bacterium]
MFYRRKILLALLQIFDNRVEKIQLQKLLFLFSEMQKQTDFHFVPYKYGCFSFQANADLGTMTKYGLVSTFDTYWQKETPEDFLKALRRHDLESMKALKYLYSHKTSEELIAHTYKKYPYFAINSKMLTKVLDKEEQTLVNAQKPTDTGKYFYTIGYEGISLEEYLNKLIKSNVKVLCDVRKNSFSMKYGFSKSQLKTACEGVGIHYYHFPDVGIDSDKRQNLHDRSDYDVLFANYAATVLPQTKDTQQTILNLLHEHHRVAITCFEAQSCQCHRSHLAQAISQLPGFVYELKHL